MIEIKKYSDINKIEDELNNNSSYDKRYSNRILSEIRELFILEMHFRGVLEDSTSLENELEKPFIYYIEEDDYQSINTMDDLDQFINNNNIPDLHNYEDYFTIHDLNDENDCFKFVVFFLSNNEEAYYLIFNPNSLFYKKFEEIF